MRGKRQAPGYEEGLRFSLLRAPGQRLYGCEAGELYVEVTGGDRPAYVNLVLPDLR